jgi:hypothetical protein
MPSRKQRRRRQKERRHEYEYVYVDEEGQEVEAPPEEPERKSRGNGRRASSERKRARPLREYQPPSWRRSARRAILFAPLFFIVFSLVNKRSAVEWRVLTSLFYSALFVPLTYLMDRTAYRTYLRRSGGEAASKRR